MVETTTLVVGRKKMTVPRLLKRTLQVVSVPRSRVGPKLVADYCTDLTPPSEFEKARAQRVQSILAREKGTGRPTKR